MDDALWEASVVAAFHRLSRADLPGDHHEEKTTVYWECSHRAFHDALVAGCGSPLLLRMHAQMVDHSKRYRLIRLFHSVPTKELVRTVIDEDELLMKAMLDRDTQRAVELVHSHLNNRLWQYLRSGSAAAKCRRSRLQLSLRSGTLPKFSAH